MAHMGMSENGLPQLVAEEYHDKPLDVGKMGLPVRHTTRFLHRKILRTNFIRPQQDSEPRTRFR